MLKKRLSLLIILLIASQSVWAMVDIPQQHQSSNEHFIAEHLHDHHEPEAEYHSAENSEHHHCHGHSAQLHFLSDSIKVPLINTSALFNGSYSSAITSAPLSNLFRPPRA